MTTGLGIPSTGQIRGVFGYLFFEVKRRQNHCKPGPILPHIYVKNIFLQGVSKKSGNKDFKMVMSVLLF